MYEVQNDNDRPGCRDVLVLTRAMFAVIVPVMGVLAALLGAAALALFLLTVHPALALIPIGVIVLSLLLYARWDQTHNRPPGL